MGEYRRILLLVTVMSTVALCVGGLAIAILYETALSEQRGALTTLVQRQAWMLNALVRYEEQTGKPLAAAIDAAVNQLTDAGRPLASPNNGVDLSIARQDGDRIVFLKRHGDTKVAMEIPATSAFAEPNRRAISGDSGSLFTVDERGQAILAAYQPFIVGHLGIIAAIPLDKLRAPFIRAAVVIGALALVLIALGTGLFFSVSEPIVRELRSREQRFRDLFDNMSSGAAVLEPVDAGADFIFRDYNPAAERIDAIGREQIVGRPLSAVFPGVVDSGLTVELRLAATTGQSRDIPEMFYRDDRISGWREYRLYGLPTGEVVMLFNDITARKATEEQLLQAQKMEVVGQLTGGVAHDFNNVLAIVVGNLQLLSERRDFDAETRALISDALWSAERGAELTHRLLAFARRQPLRPSLINVNDLISQMLRLLRRTLGSSIEIHAELATHPWPTLIDRGQLENALMNLIVNARDAIPASGGEVSIETRNVSVHENVASQAPIAGGQPMPAGDYVVLTVRDNGSGIEAGNLARIFEPFFTTKGQGRHSGLGLSMVYGFVRQSGGQVRVDSQPGLGTAVSLYLPSGAESGSGSSGGGVADDGVTDGSEVVRLPSPASTGADIAGVGATPATLRAPRSFKAVTPQLRALLRLGAVTASLVGLAVGGRSAVALAEGRSTEDFAGAIAPLTFAWPVPGRALVIQKSVRRGQETEVHFTLLAERTPAGDTLVRVQDSTVVGLNGEKFSSRSDVAVYGAATALITAAPTLRIDPAGRLVEVVGLDGVLDAIAGSRGDRPRQRDASQTEQTLSPIR